MTKITDSQIRTLRQLYIYRDGVGGTWYLHAGTGRASYFYDYGSLTQVESAGVMQEKDIIGLFEGKLIRGTLHWELTQKGLDVLFSKQDKEEIECERVAVQL